MASVTVSTIPPTRRAAEPEQAPPAAGTLATAAVSERDPDGAQGDLPPELTPVAPHTGSLSRRMMLIASAWIIVLLLVGGLALDRTLTGLITRNFDEQLGYMLTGMIGSAEIGPDGEVFFNRPLGDQRFLEPNSGLYWQITGKGHEDFPSRSLWDRTLKTQGEHFYTQPQGL